MPDLSSLTAEVARLSYKVSFWNRAVIIMMIFAALTATGLVVAQWIAIKRSESLAIATGKLTDFKENAASDRATKAERKRIELQNRMIDIFGPRKLTPQQSAKIAESLAGLKGVKVDVYVMALNSPYIAGELEDSKNIGVTIVRALRSAPALMDAEGWMLQGCQGSGASNLVVNVVPPGSNADRSIALRLLKSLQSERGTYPEVSYQANQTVFCRDISALDKSMPNSRPHGTTISIIIGNKVNPPLTREMLPSNDEEN